MLKYELIPAQLLHEGIITSDNLNSPDILDENIILQTHKSSYWERLRDLTLSPAEIRRSGFPLSKRLVERERRIAQGTINACIHAIEYGIAFNIAGGTHHAGSDWAEGFCLLNDQAIAANYLLENNLASRILIVDLDVHQGNGTAEIFREDPRVFTFSMHAEKNFPFRKEQSDLDLGLKDETADREYLALLEANLPELMARHRPDFIFYLAGVDILKSDKLGKLSVSPHGCRERDAFVIGLCKKMKIPVQISMGGGYSPMIKDIVDAHCNTFRIAYEYYF